MFNFARYFVAVFVVILVQSCNSKPTLQTYFVDHQEQPNFLAVDLPKSLLKLDESTFTNTQKEAYKSIQKLNVLMFKKDSTATKTIADELAKVRDILDDEKYEELMRGGNDTDGRFLIKVVGKDDEVDEFVLVGSSNEMGFAVVRVLGKNMDPSKLMSLGSVLPTADFDGSALAPFKTFFNME